MLNSGDPIIGKRPLKLKWGNFAGACFRCGKFGHMQFECSKIDLQPPPSALTSTPLPPRDASCPSPDASLQTVKNHSTDSPLRSKLQSEKGKNKLQQQSTLTEKLASSSNLKGKYVQVESVEL